MSQPVDTLANFLAATALEDIPSAVRSHAKLVLLDTLGVVLAGAERPEVAALRARLAPNAGTGASVWARGWLAQDPRTAALLNGTAGRAIELCEGLRLVSGQAAIQVLPGVLALAESRRASGAELLTAFILGYEAAGRFCSAFTPRPLAHQNGQASLLGAAAAGARLCGMDAHAISRTMRIATVLLLTPSYTNAVAGATSLNLAGAMSGWVGAAAPDFACAGFEAQDDAIELALGQMIGAGFDPVRLLAGLGEEWMLQRNYFRLYACCNPIHPALDALQAVATGLRPHPTAIERIDIATYRFASVMREPHPRNFFASKYSLPHAAATYLVRGALDHAALDDSALSDPAIVSLRERVHVVEEPAMTAAAPRLRPARVTVTLKDGRQASHAVQSHRGDFDDPFHPDQIGAKFRDLAGHVLDEQGIALLAAFCDNLEREADVQTAIARIGAHAKTETHTIPPENGDAHGFPERKGNA
jgi:2-methylcitrate dehydratase PrpD